MMRNLTVVLLLLALCTVTLSKGLRKRRSYSDEDGDKAALDILLKAIEEGKVDLNELLDDRASNPSRRLWFPFRIRLPGFGK